MKYIIVFIFFIFNINFCLAKPIINNKIDSIINNDQYCWFSAANYHNVNPWLLMSIAYVESNFDHFALNKNKNGSYDIGMMQINSIWFPELKKYNIQQDMLKNPCFSTYIGAWILSKNIKKYGYNWRAIGAYNSSDIKKGHIYAKKVYNAYDIITKNKK